MRNLHYKSKSFRLSDTVLEEIERRKGDFSYNQLFEVLLGLKEEKNANTIRRRGLFRKQPKGGEKC